MTGFLFQRFLVLFSICVAGVVITSANNDFSSVTDSRQLQMGDGCNGLCSVQSFCGSTQECRSYSCENWFKYSPWNLQVRAKEEKTLTCENYTTGVEDNNWAILYGCERLLPGMSMEVDDEDLFGFPFNRKCSVPLHDTGDGKVQFTCYDIQPGTDFEEFLMSHAEATWEANPIRTVCDDTSESGYYYNAFIREPTEQVVERNPDPTGVEKTEKFDVAFAYLTLHAEMTSRGGGSSSGASVMLTGPLFLLLWTVFVVMWQQWV